MKHNYTAILAIFFLAGCADTFLTPEVTSLIPEPATVGTSDTPEPTATAATTNTATPTPTPDCLQPQEVNRFRVRGGIDKVAYQGGLIAVGTAYTVYLYQGDTLRWEAPLKGGFLSAISWAGHDVVRVLLFAGETSLLIDLDATTGKVIRRRAAKSIGWASMSADGAYYLTNTVANSKRIVDAATGAELAVLRRSSGQINGAYGGTGEDWFGHQIAIATRRGIALWEAPGEEQIGLLPLDQPVSRLQIGYSTDGRYVSGAYTTSQDGRESYQFVVWNVETGASFPAQEISGTPAELGWNLNDGAAYAPNERYLFRIEEDAAQVVEVIPKDVYGVKDIHLSGDGVLVQVADRLEFLSPDWEQVFVIDEHRDTPPSTGYLTAGSDWGLSPDGSYFALSSVSHHLIYDLATGELVGAPSGRVDWGPGAWSDDNRFASGTQDGTLTVWHPGGELTSYQLPNAIYEVAWLDEQTLVVGLAKADFDYESQPPVDHSIYDIAVFDLEGGRIIYRFPIGDNPRQIVPAPGGGAVAVAGGHGEEGRLRLYMPLGAERWAIPVQKPDYFTIGLAWSPDGNRLLVEDAHTIYIIAAATGQVITDFQFEAQDAVLHHWLWDEHGFWSLLGFQPSHIVKWDMETGQPIARVELCGPDQVMDIAASDDGLRLLGLIYDENTFVVLRIDL